MTKEANYNRMTEGDSRHLQAEITTYWNGRSKEFDQSPGHGLRNQREKEVWLTTLRDLLPPPPADILDVGTGTGFLALLMVELGHCVTGTDLSQDMLEVARSKSTGPVVPRFEVGDATEPQFPPSSFDVITSRHLLWSLLEPERAFANWRRLLRPQGLALGIDTISPPSRPSPIHYSEELVKALPLRHPGTPDPALTMFKAAGFIDVRAERLEEIERLQRELDPGSERLDRHVFIAIRGD